MKYHVCCGQPIRVRMIDGKAVVQPHRCNEARDVSGKDWEAVRAKKAPSEDAGL